GRKLHGSAGVGGLVPGDLLSWLEFRSGTGRAAVLEYDVLASLRSVYSFRLCELGSLALSTQSAWRSGSVVMSRSSAHGQPNRGLCWRTFNDCVRHFDSRPGADGFRVRVVGLAAPTALLPPTG